MLAEFDVFLIERRIEHVIDAALPRRWIIDVDGALNFIEIDALNDAGKAQAMVAVEMGKGNVLNRRRSNVGISHLALCSFARIEENALGFPAQKIAVVIAIARRDLSSRSENDEFFHSCDVAI